MGCGASAPKATDDEPPVRASESIDHAATRVSASKSADAKPLEETVDEKDDGSDDSDRSPPPSPVRFSKASSDAVDGVLPSPGGTGSMPDATREKLTKIYDAIDTTDSHDRGITIYEFRAATASLNMLYLFGSFEDDEEIWCGDESVRATLDRWLSGMWALGMSMGEENFEAGLDALVEATGRLHDASTSLPPERLKLLKKVFIAMDMARFGGMTGEVDLALYRPVAATNGNGVANATMIALYAEMERRHLGVFASNTTVDLGQWLGAMAKVSREIDEHQFEADMVAMLNAAPTIMQTGAL